MEFIKRKQIKTEIWIDDKNKEHKIIHSIVLEGEKNHISDVKKEIAFIFKKYETK